MIPISKCISHLLKLKKIVQRLLRSEDSLSIAKELQAEIDDFYKVLRALDKESTMDTQNK